MTSAKVLKFSKPLHSGNIVLSERGHCRALCFLYLTHMRYEEEICSAYYLHIFLMLLIFIEICLWTILNDSLGFTKAFHQALVLRAHMLRKDLSKA